MSKHTPGPWQYYGQVKDHFCRIYDAKYRLVAIVPYGSARNPSKAAMPDSSLIAAAPELLEALKSLLADNSQEHIRTSLWDNARAAIAKAEGKQ